MGIKSEVEKNIWLDAEGSFTARLVKIEEKQYGFGNSLQFTFEVLDDPEHSGKQATGLTSKRLTPDNKTSTWVAALDPNFDLEIGKVVDFEALVGKVCRILVEEKGEYCNVVKARPLKPAELARIKDEPKAEEKKSEKKVEEPKKKEEKKSAIKDDDIDF